MRNVLKLFIVITAITTPLLYVMDYLDDKAVMQWWAPLLLAGWIMGIDLFFNFNKNTDRLIAEGKIKNRVGLWLWKK